MNHLVSEAIKATGYNLSEFSPEDSNKIRKDLETKFCRDSEQFGLWERIVSPFAVCQKHSWEWLEEFLLQKNFLFFYEENRDSIIYQFSKTNLLSEFLNEIPIQVFYVSNASLDYLICYNDHDYLIAAGTAEPWLRNKAIELSKTGWRDMDGFYWDENGVKKR
jgi:hypothetical protein